MSSLQRYLEYKRAVRVFQDSWLKSQGMTWTKLEELEQEAIAEMQTTNTETVQLEGYVAALESHPIRIAPDAGKIIGHDFRISLHQKR
jgi:hypothetical protein